MMPPLERQDIVGTTYRSINKNNVWLFSWTIWKLVKKLSSVHFQFIRYWFKSLKIKLKLGKYIIYYILVSYIINPTNPNVGIAFYRFSSFVTNFFSLFKKIDAPLKYLLFSFYFLFCRICAPLIFPNDNHQRVFLLCPLLFFVSEKKCVPRR